MLEGMMEDAEHVREKINEKRKENKGTDREASHNAFLAEKMATVMRELRQLDKHDQVKDENIADGERVELMLASASKMPVEQRAKLIAALLEQEKGKKV
jgi:hypothetical protein